MRLISTKFTVQQGSNTVTWNSTIILCVTKPS